MLNYVGRFEVFDFILPVSLQAANGDALTNFVARQYERLLRRECKSCVERDNKANKERLAIEHGGLYQPHITVQV